MSDELTSRKKKGKCFPKEEVHGLWNSLPKDESKCYKDTEKSEEDRKPPSMTIFKEKLRECGKQGSWQMQISAVSLLSSPWRQLPDLGNWVRQMLPPVGCDNSCFLRDLWWLSQGKKEPSECHLEKALVLLHYHHQNQKTKNTFRKKCASLVLNSRMAEKAMEKTSLLYYDTCLARVATKIFHQIFWALMQGRNVPKLLGGNYICFAYYFLYKCVHLGVNVCDLLFRLHSSFNYGNVCILFFFLTLPVFLFAPKFLEIHGVTGLHLVTGRFYCAY